jgi:hypothetical protein
MLYAKTTSLDVTLDFQSASDCLVVVLGCVTSLDHTLDLNPARHRLIMVSGMSPALTLVLTFSPSTTVWLCWWDSSREPDLTLVLTFRLRATFWLWLLVSDQSPALTFVLIFILAHSFWISTLTLNGDATTSASRLATVACHYFMREWEGETYIGMNNIFAGFNYSKVKSQVRHHNSYVMLFNFSPPSCERR